MKIVLAALSLGFILSRMTKRKAAEADPIVIDVRIARASPGRPPHLP